MSFPFLTGQDAEIQISIKFANIHIRITRAYFCIKQSETLWYISDKAAS